MELEEIKSLLISAIRDECDKSTMLTRKNILSRKRNASGNWIKNSFHIINETLNHIIIEYVPHDINKLGKKADWDVRNKGRGAGKVNFQKILEWVRVKGIAYSGKGSDTRGEASNTRSAAFLIANKIREHGTSFQKKHKKRIYDKNFALLYTSINSVVDKKIDEILNDALISFDKTGK